MFANIRRDRYSRVGVVSAMAREKRNEEKRAYTVEERGVKVQKGRNYVADHIQAGIIEKKRVDILEELKTTVSQLLKYYGGLPAWIVCSYASHRIENNYKLAKSYEELLDMEFSKFSYFFKPEFLRGYTFTYGALKSGELGYYDLLGNITNFSGTFYDVFAYLYDIIPEIIRDEIKEHIRLPREEKLPEYIRDIAKDEAINLLEKGIKIKLSDFIGKIQFEYNRLGERVQRKVSTFFNFVKRIDEKREGAKKELAIGGWIPHPTMRETLIEGNPSITYRFVRDTKLEDIEVYEKEDRRVIKFKFNGKPMEVEIRGSEEIPHLIEQKKSIEFKKEQPISEDDVEVIAKLGLSMPWGIAEVRENQEFKDWLVIPERYKDKAIFVDEKGNRIKEETPPFRTAGIIWVFDYNEGMFAGGDKAPGTSVAAPLNTYFIELLMEGRDKFKSGKDKFKESVGYEPKKFIAALEVVFKDRKKEINWREGYQYPFFFPTDDLRRKYQKDFIGVHRLDHVDRIIVKDVQWL